MKTTSLKLEKIFASVRSDACAVLDGRTQLLEPIRGKNLLVTGGTGFLGCWLLELLSVLNDTYSFNTSVTVLSRNSSGFLAHWPRFEGEEWLRLEDGDVRHLSEIPTSVNHIIHAAALTDRRDFSSQATSVAETNVFGTANLLRACERLENLEKITLMSSGLIYGKQSIDVAYIDENYSGTRSPPSDVSLYAESKRMAEAFAIAAIIESKMPIAILRPFAFVGPYQSLDSPWAITDFIRDCIHGGPIKIMGDGLTVRSIMYASDFAYSVLAVTASGQERSIYNVGSNEGVELLSLANQIANCFTPKPEIQTQVGQTTHERNRLVPDTRSIERDLGVKITVSLSDAIKKSVEWHQAMQAVSGLPAQ
jgi:nucleoside-diphosphate-sugar epimerase